MVRIKVSILFIKYLSTIFFKFRFFQYALTHKTENAHEDSIWTCGWGCPKTKKDIRPDNEDSR